MNVVDFQKKSAPGSNQGKTDKEIWLLEEECGVGSDRM